MKRTFSALAAAVAVTLGMAGSALADHDRLRGDGVVTLRIGPIEFVTRPKARHNRRSSAVVMRSFPYDDDDFMRLPFPRGDARWVRRQELHQRELDRQLGRGLYEIRRNGAVAASRRPVPAPRPAAPVVSRPVIVEELQVLGPPPPAAPSLPGPAPLTEVGTASAADVTRYGPSAFALLSAPAALGLPDLPDGGSYYVLNGRVVTLDAEAQQALTVAALEAALQ